jgi:epoxide hydrolase 4
MMWGMKDVVLGHRMARPSMDYCEDGKLVFFPDTTHWVQLDAQEVNELLIKLVNG